MPSTAESHPLPSTQSRQGASGCVLYVDDDPSHLASVCAAFAGDGFELLTAATGELGLELARARVPDLILLGLELPRMSGAEAVAVLRESDVTAHIPIVALSSAARQRVPGLSMYCRKPVQLSELRAMVHVLLARSRRGALAGAGAALARGGAPARARKGGSPSPS